MVPATGAPGRTEGSDRPSAVQWEEDVGLRLEHKRECLYCHRKDRRTGEGRHLEGSRSPPTESGRIPVGPKVWSLRS